MPDRVSAGQGAIPPPTRHCCNRCSALLDAFEQGELVAMIRFDGEDDPVLQRENADAALKQLQADGLIHGYAIEGA